MKEKFVVSAKTEELDTVQDFIRGHLEEAQCPPDTRIQIEIAVEEIFTNISSYAYGENTGKAVVRCWIEKEPLAVHIQFSDGGKPYNPLKLPEPDITLPASRRSIGGLGIFLVKRNMDEIVYHYDKGKNILTITKRIGGTEDAD